MHFSLLGFVNYIRASMVRENFREFSKKGEKIFDIVRVSEKSGNSVFPFIVHKFSSLF